MSREELELDLVAAGWKIADRSSQHLLVGRRGDLSVLAYRVLTRRDDPTFELIDSNLAVGHWVRVIPTPRIAEVLLKKHGEPLV
jgi:hypothetical protein